MNEESDRSSPDDLSPVALDGAIEGGVVLLDQSGRIRFASAIAWRLLRCESDDLPDVGAMLAQAVPLDAGGDEASGAPARMVVTTDGDGESRRLLAVTYRFSLEDGPGAVVLLWDLERWQGLDRELRFAGRFRAIGRLYQSMAHDLRVPVATLRLAAGVLRTATDHAARTRSDVDLVRWLDALDEAVSTIDQSLGLLLGELAARDETDRQFDLCRVGTSVCKLVMPHAREARIAVQIESPAEPVVVDGSPHRLRLALLNIAMNAIEAMPDGGTLRLIVRASSGQAIIGIADSGSGVPPALRDSIFEEGFTTKASGCGLGLHLAREIVEEHGGRIELESGIAGAEFVVTIPRCCDAPADPALA